MPTITLNGPVIPSGVTNAVMKEALFHSPAQRLSNSTNYHVIRVGIREGEFTSWVGTWDQSTQKIDGATPTSILNDGRHGMRLRADQAVVVEVSSEGAPATLEGSRINFRLALVGGVDGPAKPLVASGVAVADAGARTALAALERQVNAGVAEWEEGVQLQDPAPLAPLGAFGGRLQVDSTTQISLRRFVSPWVDVDGEPVSIGTDGILLTTSNGLLAASGGVTSTAPSSSTLYRVYLSQGGLLRLSATAPTAYLGAYYLGTDAGSRVWRFCGWVYTNSSTQFVDSATNRHLCNYYNRRRLQVLLTPGYADDNAATTYTTTSTSYTAANTGTGATGSYIANGEDVVSLRLSGTMVNSNAGVFTYAGIGDNSATTSVASALVIGTSAVSAYAAYASVPAAGYRTVVLLVAVSANTGTYYADLARAGSATDPRATYLIADVMA